MLILRFIRKLKTKSMFQYKSRSILIALFCVALIQNTFAQEPGSKADKKMLEDGIRILRTYFLQDKNWHMIDGGVEPDITGLINYIEDAPLDSVLSSLNRRQQTDSVYVFRLPENVPDSLSVPGYIAVSEVRKNIDMIRVDLENEVKKNPIQVPQEIIDDAKLKAPIVPDGKGMILFTDSVYKFPENLIIPDVIPDSVLNSPEQFNRLVKIDSLRNEYVEQKRLEYNESVMKMALAQATQQYRTNLFEQQLRFKIKRYRDSVDLNNYKVLKEYNDRVVASVNDTIRSVIDVLTAYADYVDTVSIRIENLKGYTGDILLQNGREHFSRIWLKNEQNDSLQLLLKSTDKRGMQMLINDGVTLQRLSERQTKDFDFSTLKGDMSNFSKPGKAYAVQTPWNINGDGSVGFTQTYFENWKKGGESALALLIILKGSANYSSSDGKVKWDNSAEIRNGWLKTGGDKAELKKNDDKFELTSRYGYSAFKKWYYSAEFNFNTQFFRGYKYPKADNPVPISSFLAPSKTFFKVGLDYKPSPEFSLFLSPLSLKNVFVKDTALIDQTKFGVAENRKAFWEPGLNADLKYKTKLTQDITFETKYKMFVNYKDPFKKLDIDWENNLRMQLNDYIDLRVMLHLLYDDNVKFPVYNDEGTQVGEKAKLQIEEFVTIGFSYKINRKVMRTKRLR